MTTKCARVLVVALAILTAVATVAFALSYDRQAAVDYARTYWDKVCSDGFFFAERSVPLLLTAGESLPAEPEGFDCAHFVSCCIGNEPNQPGGGLNVPSRTAVYGEPGAQRLTDWLLSQGATTKRRVSDLVPGDVIAYDADRNGWIEHVVLYMGNGLVASHSASQYSKWDPDPSVNYTFVHLPGAPTAGRMPRILGVAEWLSLVISIARIAATFFFGLL